MALIGCSRDDPRAARTDPRLHPDQARWQVRKPRLKLAAPPLLTQNDRFAPAPSRWGVRREVATYCGLVVLQGRTELVRSWANADLW
jgi:hypothetical protein